MIILVQFFERNVHFEQIQLFLFTWNTLFQCSLSGSNVAAQRGMKVFKCFMLLRVTESIYFI